MDQHGISQMAAIVVDLTTAVKVARSTKEELMVFLPLRERVAATPTVNFVFQDGEESGLKLTSLVATQMRTVFLEDSSALPMVPPDDEMYQHVITMWEVHMYRLIAAISVYALVNCVVARTHGHTYDIKEEVAQQINYYRSDFQQTRTNLILDSMLRLQHLRNGTVTRETFNGKWL